MRRLSVIVLLVSALAAPVAAAQGQQPPPTQPTTAPPSQQPPPAGRGGIGGQRAGRGSLMPPGGAVRDNIRIDVSITDSAEKTQKKVVSMLVADRNGGRIRSSNEKGVLNVDANTWTEGEGRITLALTVEYMPDRATHNTLLNQSITLVLQTGKPTLISQSADPGTDRKVTVEVTATVVK